MFTYAFDVLVAFNIIEFGTKFRIGIYRPYFFETASAVRIMLVTPLQAAKVVNNAATAQRFLMAYLMFFPPHNNIPL